METTSQQKSELKRSCINCGAELLYAPGTTELQCNYCGHTENIEANEHGFQELELKAYLDEMGAQSHSEEITMLHCKNCGANQHIEENYKSLHCVYCSTPLIIEDAYKEDWILPGAVLPFQIDQKKAHQVFKKWVKDLWFAPNNLLRDSICRIGPLMLNYMLNIEDSKEIIIMKLRVIPIATENVKLDKCVELAGIL